MPIHKDQSDLALKVTRNSWKHDFPGSNIGSATENYAEGTHKYTNANIT